MQALFEWCDEGIGCGVHYPSERISTCTSDLSVVDRQASDGGRKLAVVEVGLVVAVRVSLRIVLISAS